jgi:hypothetical protein
MSISVPSAAAATAATAELLFVKELIASLVRNYGHLEEVKDSFLLEWEKKHAEVKKQLKDGPVPFDPFASFLLDQDKKEEDYTSSDDSQTAPRRIAYLSYKTTKGDPKKPYHLFQGIEEESFSDRCRKIKEGLLLSPTPTVKWTAGTKHDPSSSVPNEILTHISRYGSQTKEELMNHPTLLSSEPKKKKILVSHLRELLEQGLLIQ